jgi:hypothetical protein
MRYGEHRRLGSVEGSTSIVHGADRGGTNVILPRQNTTVAGGRQEFALRTKQRPAVVVRQDLPVRKASTLNLRVDHTSPKRKRGSRSPQETTVTLASASG